MLLLIQYTLIFASVLILVALGGCFSEHSGVINIGLEGIMVMGALGGALMMKYLPDSAPAPVVILLVVLASVLVGMIFSLLLGVAAIHFNADTGWYGPESSWTGSSCCYRKSHQHGRKSRQRFFHSCLQGGQESVPDKNWKI